MNTLKGILWFLILNVVLSSGCQLASNVPPSEDGHGTTAEVILTRPSEGTLFRDDFDGQLSPAWTWHNEDAAHYKLNEDGWLEITVGDENTLIGGKQANLLWTPLPEGNIEVLVHLKAQPLFDYQHAGLVLYEDPEHYVFLNQGYCMQCVLGGSGIFLEYRLNAHQGRFTTASSASDLYLLLLIEHGAVSAFFATKADEWQHIATLESDIQFTRVGLAVANDSTWDTGYDLIGLFDYFEIRRPTQIMPTPTPGLFPEVRANNVRPRP
jgi:beta-xylosidase